MLIRRISKFFSKKRDPAFRLAILAITIFISFIIIGSLINFYTGP